MRRETSPCVGVGCEGRGGRSAADTAKRSPSRDANADQEDQDQYRGGSGCGMREEINENVVETHGKQYGTDYGFDRGYEKARTKVGDEE